MSLYSSHLLQPLDVSVFGSLKWAYRKLIKERMRASNNHTNKYNCLSLYPSVCEKIFIRKNTYNGFAEVGLKLLLITKRGFVQKLSSNYIHQHHYYYYLKIMKA